MEPKLALPYWPSIVLSLLMAPAAMLQSIELFWVAAGASFGWHLAYTWLVTVELCRVWRMNARRKRR